MQRYANPFTPTFGIVPPFMAGRTYVIEDILNALDEGPGDPNLATIFIGARGTGKTALLSYLANEATRHGWISVNVVAGPGMLEDMYQQTKIAAREFIETSESPKLKGITIAQLFGIEWEAAPREELNWRSRMSELIAGLEKYGIGLLFTIDEVSASLDEMVSFASTYQLFVREGKRVGLLMAGLPHQVSMLLRSESISFLRRCVQHRLSGVSDAEIASALKLTIESGGRTASPEAIDGMLHAIGGFPFMMQLVGYRSWGLNPAAREITFEDVERGVTLAQQDLDARVLDPTYYELSRGDIRFLDAMLEDDGVSDLADIAERMGVTSNYASKYRARLVEQGIVGTRGRGRVAFDMPHFREYLLEKKQE
ncbi:MAG: ATP-binding protein [Coriobacteriaceae bacterium]|nr:ATP-binding protein [Coriobacteriaceae bacterium]